MNVPTTPTSTKPPGNVKKSPVLSITVKSTIIKMTTNTLLFLVPNVKKDSWNSPLTIHKNINKLFVSKTNLKSPTVKLIVPVFIIVAYVTMDMLWLKMMTIFSSPVLPLLLFPTV